MPEQATQTSASDYTDLYGIIYKITNTKNDKIYIGQTKSKKNVKGKLRDWTAECRLNEHKRNSCMESTMKKSPNLYEAMRQDGVDNFTVETLFTCELDETDKWERYFIDTLDARKTDIGYNISLSCNTNKSLINPSRNIKVTDELRQRLSKTKNEHTNITECHRNGKLVGYRIRINYNGTLSEKRFTSTKFSPEENFQKAQEFLESIKTQEPTTIPMYNKTTNCLTNIYPKKIKGVVCGYEVSITIDGKSYITSKKLSLDEKLEKALEYKANILDGL